MKLISKICLLLSLVIVSFSGVQAGFLDGIFQESQPKVQYCNNGECGLQQGIEQVKGIDGMVTDRKASVYAQDIVKYLLGFLYLAGVIMIIYAGFQLVVGAGSDDKAKSSKSMIIYVVIGFLIIFLASPIISFILKVLETPAGN